MAKIQVSTKINNENVDYLCEPHETMLDVLRNQLSLTGSKESCGSGDCGSCSVILDGELICSCLMLICFNLKPIYNLTCLMQISLIATRKNIT